MLGICAGALSDWNGRPTPWNRPIRSSSLCDAHRVEHLVGRVVLDVDHHAFAAVAEMRRQAAERLGRDHLEFEQRRRLQRPPGQRIGQGCGPWSQGIRRSCAKHRRPTLTVGSGGCARLTPRRRWGSVAPCKLRCHNRRGVAVRGCWRRRAGRRAPAARASGAGRRPTRSAQSQPRRARPRIRVRPIYPYRRYHSLYPLPYDIEYPGPNAKRDCVAPLRHRASAERHRGRAAHALLVGAGLTVANRTNDHCELVTAAANALARRSGDRGKPMEVHVMSKLLATCAAVGRNAPRSHWRSPASADRARARLAQCRSDRSSAVQRRTAELSPLSRATALCGAAPVS